MQVTIHPGSGLPLREIPLSFLFQKWMEIQRQVMMRTLLFAVNLTRSAQPSDGGCDDPNVIIKTLREDLKKTKNSKKASFGRALMDSCPTSSLFLDCCLPCC